MMKNHIQTRWGNAENPLGLKGRGGTEKNGRKGCGPYRDFTPGKSIVIATAENVSGMIRHIWITLEDRSPVMLKSVLLEIFWDREEKPAVSVPLGDFFCINTGRCTPFENEFFSNPEGRSFNCYIPMPFKNGMKVVLTNRSERTQHNLFAQVDYTIGDVFTEETLYFHAYYTRDSYTKMRQDYTILPKLSGKGVFVGASFGIIANPQLNGTWWGEGEVKCYLDGDAEYPTLCGTGTEDYIGTAWGLGEFYNRYQGCLHCDNNSGRYALYRFHVKDPVYFHTDIRVTIQQMGWTDANGVQKMRHNRAMIRDAWNYNLLDLNLANDYFFERYGDDWSSIAYFYLDKPTSELDLCCDLPTVLEKY